MRGVNMSEEYKKFISFLSENVNNDIELDCIIYNIGAAQRIAEQFSNFYSQKIQDNTNISDEIAFEIDFEIQCNEKIHLALGIGSPKTLFIECETHDNDFLININRIQIAKLTLEGVRSG